MAFELLPLFVLRLPMREVCRRERVRPCREGTMLARRLAVSVALALFLWPALGEAQSPELIEALQQHKDLYSQGLWQEAIPVTEKAVGLGEREFGADNPRTAALFSILATLYANQGRYAEAAPLLKRTLAINEKQFGPEDIDVAISLIDLALIYYHQGRYADAEPVLKRSLAIRERILGPEHLVVAQSIANYAVLLRETRREVEAAEMEARAKAIRDKHAKEKR